MTEQNKNTTADTSKVESNNISKAAEKNAQQRKAEAIKNVNKQRAEKNVANETLASTKSSMPKTAPNTQSNTTKISQPKKSKTAMLALFIALVSAGGVGGLFYWQQQQSAQLVAQINTQNQQQSLLNQQQTAKLLASQQQQANNKIATAISKFEAQQQTKITQLEQQIAQLSQRKANDWLVLESQYLIRVALRSLWLTHNTGSAINLLHDADQRLKSLNSPQYLPVRQAINQDIVALQLLPQLTTDETILKLMGLAQQLDKLPLIKIKGIEKKNEQAFQLSENASDWRENLARSWHKFIDDFITIRRQDNAVIPLMSPQYQQNLRENLSLKIQLAQWAASHGKVDLYQRSLNDIQQWHQQYFAMDNVLNVNFNESIKNLKQAVITITLPKTLTSLTAIEQVIKPKFELPAQTPKSAQSPKNSATKPTSASTDKQNEARNSEQKPVKTEHSTSKNEAL